MPGLWSISILANWGNCYATSIWFGLMELDGLGLDTILCGKVSAGKEGHTPVERLQKK